MRLGDLVIFISMFWKSDGSPIIGIPMIELNKKMQLFPLGLKFLAFDIYEILMTKFCLGIYEGK